MSLLMSQVLPGKPFVSRQQVSLASAMGIENDMVEKERTGERTVSAVQVRITVFWTLASKGPIFPGCLDEFDADATPVQPRFLLQELVFTVHTCPNHASVEISCGERIGFL